MTNQPLPVAGRIETPDQESLAYVHTPGSGPTVVMLGGFRSSMDGLKAKRFETYCTRRGNAYLRLDYRGHGQSSGEFADGNLGNWIGDALQVIQACTQGPLVLIGSSMGGWVMVHIALRLSERVIGMLGIAPAPDFTEDLFHRRLRAEQREELRREGLLELPSEYDASPAVITKALIDEARSHLVLDRRLDIDCPVRLVHGMRDPDVPWRTSERLMAALTGSDVHLRLLKNGGHRLSEPEELTVLESELESLLRGIANA